MLKSVVALFSGTAVAQAITLAIAPIVTRLYMPADFGLLGLFTSYLAILGSVASFRYELAIPLPETDEEAWGIAKLCFLILVIFTTLFTITLWVTSDTLASLLGAEAMLPYLWLMPTALLFFGFYQIFTQAALRYRKYKAVAVTRVLQSMFGASVQVGGGFFGFGAGALLAGAVISAGSGGLHLAYNLRQYGIINLDGKSWNDVVLLARRYSRFALLTSPAALLNVLTLNLPPLFLASIYDIETAGQFFLAQRVLNLPLMLMSTSVSQSYTGEASLLRRQGKNISQPFWKLVKVLITFTVPISLGIFYLSPTLFPIVFGEVWSDAGKYASLMTIFLGVRFITSSLAPTFVIFERQDISLLLQTISIFSVVISFGISVYFSWEPMHAITLYAYILALPYIAGFYFLVKLVLSEEDDG